MICQIHGALYGAKHSSNKAAHISQASGKKSPTPILLDDLDYLHPAAGTIMRIEECNKELIKVIAPRFSEIKKTLSNDSTCFGLLGSDILIDRGGKTILCEVNTHPALGWGTMGKVPNKVFDSLIEDTLAVLLQKTSALEKSKYIRILPYVRQ